jgi:hypothetical protein
MRLCHSLGFLCLIIVSAVGAACADTTVTPVTFNPYGSCDTAFAAALIPSTFDMSLYCPGLACQGAYYALCDGTQWDSCACGVPDGDTVITWSDYAQGVDSVDSGPSTEDADDSGLAVEDSVDGTPEGSSGFDGSSTEDAFPEGGVSCGDDF